MKASQPLEDDDPRHGTRTGYGRYRCRCESCRQAEADYRNALREWQGERPLALDDPRHGTVNLYSHHRCRCRKCTEANRLRVVRQQGRSA